MGEKATLKIFGAAG